MIKKLITALLLPACLGIASASAASEELLLRFHILLAGNNHAFIGGTLQNMGSQPIAHGFMVATLFDAHCRPYDSVIYKFSGMAPGKREFRVPAPAGFKYYSISHLAAFDHLGRPLQARDEHAAQMAERIAKETAECASSER